MLSPGSGPRSGAGAHTEAVHFLIHFSNEGDNVAATYNDTPSWTSPHPHSHSYTPIRGPVLGSEDFYHIPKGGRQSPTSPFSATITQSQLVLLVTKHPGP